MIIYSTRLGEIEIQESDIIRFPHALPGFPEETSFIMFAYEADSPFFLLQSTITPELTFALVDPFEFFKDYEIKLDDETIAELELSEENYPKIYAIVTVPEDIKDMTANLIAPVVINWKTKTAMQAILEKSGYNIRHRIFPLAPKEESCEKEKEKE